MYSSIPASSKRSLLGLIPGRFAFVWIVTFSVSINLLLLVIPFYSIEVFDRVIGSGSIETLVGLTVIAVCALVFSAMFVYGLMVILAYRRSGLTGSLNSLDLIRLLVIFKSTTSGVFMIGTRNLRINFFLVGK